MYCRWTLQDCCNGESTFDFMFWVSLVRVSSEKEKISSYAERPPTGAKNNPDAEYKICPQEARDSEDAYG